MSSNLDQGEVYSMPHYVMKFVSDLRQTGRWFSPGTPVFSTKKSDLYDIAEIVLKVALNTIKQTNKQTNPSIILMKTYGEINVRREPHLRNQSMKANV
jgi:hypothetical protein